MTEARYFALKTITKPASLGGGRWKRGDEVEGAAAWPNLATWIKTRHIGTESPGADTARVAPTEPVEPEAASEVCPLEGCGKVHGAGTQVKAKHEEQALAAAEA